MTTRDGRPTVGQRFAALAALTVFDAVATLIAVGLLDGVELNPLLGLVIGHVGLTATMALRVVVGIAGAGGLALLADHPRSRFGVRPLRWATVALSLVAFWHVASFALYFT